MLYEIHITVDFDDIRSWRAFCEAQQIKPLFIWLSSGHHPMQLMCAATFHGEPESAKDHVERLAQKVRRQGFAIRRVKLECPLGLAGALQNFAYHECHLKLLIRESESRKALALCEELPIHASRNLLAENAGVQKWYLTRRLYDTSAAEAKDEFTRILRETRKQLSVEKMDMECAIFDTNPEIDAGWV